MSERREHGRERLVQAYNRMMERLRAALQGGDKGRRPALDRLIAQAKDEAVKRGELSPEEAEQVGRYLDRDLHSAARRRAAAPDLPLADWLRIDIEAVENRLLDLLLSVSDPTEVELLNLEHAALHASEYHSGEIAGIGTLQCVRCGHLLRFTTTGQIPECPQCGGREFRREPH